MYFIIQKTGISVRGWYAMPSSIINKSKKFRNKPVADKKCHKSCLSNIPIVHGLFMSLDKAGETFVVFSLDINNIIAGIQHIIDSTDKI